jgi:hypothetical protein
MSTQAIRLSAATLPWTDSLSGLMSQCKLLLRSHTLAMLECASTPRSACLRAQDVVIIADLLLLDA